MFPYEAIHLPIKNLRVYIRYMHWTGVLHAFSYGSTCGGFQGIFFRLEYHTIGSLEKGRVHGWHRSF